MTQAASIIVTMKFIGLVPAVFLAAIANATNKGADEVMASNSDINDICAQLIKLQRCHVGWLLNHPGVEVNHKIVGGEQTDQLSLVIWVKKKLPEEEVSEKRRLPREIEGFQTDIVEREIEPLRMVSSDQMRAC